VCQRNPKVSVYTNEPKCPCVHVCQRIQRSVFAQTRLYTFFCQRRFFLCKRGQIPVLGQRGKRRFWVTAANFAPKSPNAGVGADEQKHQHSLLGNDPILFAHNYKLVLSKDFIVSTKSVLRKQIHTAFVYSACNSIFTHKPIFEAICTLRANPPSRPSTFIATAVAHCVKIELCQNKIALLPCLIDGNFRHKSLVHANCFAFQHTFGIVAILHFLK